MLRLITVTDTSDISYSEAVKSAINALIAQGEKVHFFVLQEHRGSVKNGKIEYQVVVQASVE